MEVPWGERCSVAVGMPDFERTWYVDLAEPSELELPRFLNDDPLTDVVELSLHCYTPNAGARPQAIVGRDDQLASFDLLLGRLQRGRTEQSMIITGLRGVGKTVLLGQFRAKALQSDWVVVELEASKHDDATFRRVLSMHLRTALFELAPRASWGKRLRRAAAALKSFTLTVDQQGSWSASIDIDPVEGLADHGDLALDLVDVLTSLGYLSPEGEVTDA